MISYAELIFTAVRDCTAGGFTAVRVCIFKLSTYWWCGMAGVVIFVDRIALLVSFVKNEIKSISKNETEAVFNVLSVVHELLRDVEVRDDELKKKLRAAKDIMRAEIENIEKNPFSKALATIYITKELLEDFHSEAELLVKQR